VNARYWIERGLAFLIVVVVLVLILWPERAYVPIWDGRVYADCAVSAAQHGLSMLSLRCAGHPSQGYAVFLALSQMVRLGDVRLLFAVNALLGIGALLCIRLLLEKLFPDRTNARALDLLTLACAVHPVVLSTLLQVNIDFGVYVFFFAALAALVWRRYALAAVAGVLLCFSKETGTLVYALMIALWGLYEWMPEADVSARFRRLRPMWPLTVPLALFALHVATFTGARHESAIWKQGWKRSALDGFVWFDFSEPIFRSYAAGILVLGFMWVVTAVIGADLIAGGLRMARRRGGREVPGTDRRLLSYLTVLTAITAYVLTSFRTWSNLRYFALLYPLLIILSFAALVRLRAGPALRMTALAIITGLFGFAAFRSADPLSRVVYGTFPIGERVMYRMSSITGEGSGPGRDQLVYNLEFTGFHHVQNALFRNIQPNAQTVIATARLTNWELFSPLDSGTFERTLSPGHSFEPRYLDEVTVAAAADHPENVWFLEFSNHPEPDGAMASLSRRYQEVELFRVHARGHAVTAHHLVARQAPVLP
jgi:hypothetical protein